EARVVRLGAVSRTWYVSSTGTREKRQKNVSGSPRNAKTGEVREGYGWVREGYARGTGRYCPVAYLEKKNPHSQLISTTLTSPLSLLSLLTGDASSPYSPSHRRGSPSLTVTVTGDYLSHSPHLLIGDATSRPAPASPLLRTRTRQAATTAAAATGLAPRPHRRLA
ncbi:hypothetical protein Tsubulata_036254, partial [Turnera subulata]